MKVDELLRRLKDVNMTIKTQKRGQPIPKTFVLYPDRVKIALTSKYVDCWHYVSRSPHLDRVAAESFYTPALLQNFNVIIQSASVRIVASSRGGACPTDCGSTPFGEPRLIK
jgi:hypothetical protein